MFEKRNNPEHPDGLMIKNFVMDRKITWGKNTTEKQIRLGTTQTRQRRNRKIRVTAPDPREMEIAQVGPMSYGACHTSPPAVLLAPLAPFVLLHRI